MIIFPLISLIAITGLTRYITKVWISPGVFFCVCWTFFLIIPIIFAPDYKIDHLAIWFITIFSMSLATGSIMAYSKDSIKPKHTTIFQNHPKYEFIFYVLIVLLCLNSVAIYLLFQYVINIYSIGSYINDWMIIPNMISIDRYAEVLNYPFVIRFGLYTIYPANLLGGILFGWRGKLPIVRFISLLPLFFAVFLGLIEGARTSIILSFVLFFSSWLSNRKIYQKDEIDIKRKYVRTAIGSVVFVTLFIFFFILIQWLRQGMDIIVVELLIDSIRAYFFGYLAAFSEWMKTNSDFNLNAGLITFAGPFNLMGFIERPLGFYDPVNIANGVSTNIFTAFRGIVSDFSIPGSIIIAFLIGFISQIIFQNKNETNLFSTIPISMFYAFTIYSPLISIFHYNSILFSWIILLIIFFIDKYETVDNYS